MSSNSVEIEKDIKDDTSDGTSPKPLKRKMDLLDTDELNEINKRPKGETPSQLIGALQKISNVVKRTVKDEKLVKSLNLLHSICEFDLDTLRPAYDHLNLTVINVVNAIMAQDHDMNLKDAISISCRRLCDLLMKKNWVSCIALRSINLLEISLQIDKVDDSFAFAATIKRLKLDFEQLSKEYKKGANFIENDFRRYHVTIIRKAFRKYKRHLWSKQSIDDYMAVIRNNIEIFEQNELAEVMNMIDAFIQYNASRTAPKSSLKFMDSHPLRNRRGT